MELPHHAQEVRRAQFCIARYSYQFWSRRFRNFVRRQNDNFYRNRQSYCIRSVGSNPEPRNDQGWKAPRSDEKQRPRNNHQKIRCPGFKKFHFSIRPVKFGCSDFPGGQWKSNSNDKHSNRGLNCPGEMYCNVGRLVAVRSN